jgi:putative hydrolase of the HAD superfamily
MNKPIIIFDLDDTLIHCNKYFNMVLDQFSVIMLDWFKAFSLTPQHIKQKQLQLDIAGIDKHGFTIEHFPKSLIETYHYYSSLCQRSSSSLEEHILRELGYSVYQYPPEPYPHMNETLTMLESLGYHLYLYTGGDQTHQWKKIRQVNLEAYFGNRIFVSQHKNKQTMQQFIANYQLDPQHTWMIGNSMKTDIVPAVHAGIHSIYIPSQQEWLYNHATLDVTPLRGYYQTSSLLFVADIIESHHVDGHIEQI